MNIPDPEWVTTIFVEWLATNPEGLEVGDGEAPENGTYPYLVVTPLSPFLVEGGLNDSQSQHAVEWQVTSVGLTRQHAQGGLAAARGLVFGGTFPDFTPASYRRSGDPALVPGPALNRDDSDKPSLFYAIETYRYVIVPA